jgi:ribosomal protein S7
VRRRWRREEIDQELDRKIWIETEVRINRIMMNGKKRKSFSWIRGGCSQVDQGSGL